MRCQDCSKFVSHELAVEWDTEPDETGEGGSITLRLECSECGGELSTYSADATPETEFDFDAHQGDEHEVEINWEDPEPNECYQETDRNGKPIKNRRYQKHLYFATASGTITCSCGEKGDIEVTSDKAAGSEFDPI